MKWALTMQDNIILCEVLTRLFCPLILSSFELLSDNKCLNNKAITH